MIDGDLQYPPEAIPGMVKMLDSVDVVVANRKERKTSLIRKITSHGFRFIFGTLLHDLHCDIQSGLKVFKKETLRHISLSPTPWTFDTEFLIKLKKSGYIIGNYDILFSERKYGTSNVKLIPSILEIGLVALKLKFQQSKFFYFTQKGHRQERVGFYYNGQKYKTYTSLSPSESAFFQLSRGQASLGLFMVVAFGVALLRHWHSTILLTIALITFLYFADMFFNLYVIIKGFLEEQKLKKQFKKDSEIILFRKWPKYTIFCPLYKEWEVLSQFVASIQALDYPKDRLQVLLLLEEEDTETIEKVKSFNLPYYFETIVVPHSLPKTKPKACNYGLQFAKGTYSVIYDAEDIPEVDQLKKSIFLFENAPSNTACVQAKLNFYNPEQNTLTKLFTSEYSLWFDLILTGLHAIEGPIPLGGTSNHFKTNILRKVDGWDSFNVTEDCDLGIRLSKYGYQTSILNSTTYEEANSDPKSWLGQRSRWIKGYIQTYFVHMRNPGEFFKKGKKTDAIIFQLVVGGKILSLFINPIMWTICILYFTFRMSIGTFIESFFPLPILYMSVISVVAGNFLYLYYYMIGCAKRGYYQLIPLGFLVPIYWMMMSVAAWMAIYGFIKNPHYWAKTKHGLHLIQTQFAI